MSFKSGRMLNARRDVDMTQGSIVQHIIYYYIYSPYFTTFFNVRFYIGKKPDTCTVSGFFLSY